MKNNSPSISILVQCGPNIQTTSNFIQSLKSTQLLDKCELLFVGSNKKYFHEIDIPEAYKVSYYLTNEEYKPEDAFTLAVNNSCAKYIFYVEDHILFENDIITPIIKLFENNDYSAICPSIQHANPEGRISRAIYIVEYSDWNEIREEGEVNSFIAGRNIAYKKSVLSEQGSDLVHYLRNQTYLQMKLLERGHKFYFTKQARIMHIHVNSLWRSANINFWHGWDSADAKQKIENWSIFRRILMAFVIQAKPFVRLYLNFKNNMKIARLTGITTFEYLIGSMVIFYSGSIGEAAGYILGTKNSPAKNIH